MSATPPTSKEKWIISAWSVLAFFLVTNPITYIITNKLRSINPILATLNTDGSPTEFGYVLHLLVFFLGIRLMMEVKLPGLKQY